MASKTAAPATAPAAAPAVPPVSAPGSEVAPAKPAAPTQAVTKRETKVNNYIAVVAVVCVVVILICGLIAKSLLGSVLVDSQLIIKDTKANGDLTTKLHNSQQLVGNYHALGSRQQQLLADALPPDPDFPALISEFQAISADSAVNLKTITPGIAGGSGTGAQTYQFTAEVGGNYGQIIQFFKDLERSARPMKAVNVQLAGDGNVLDASVTIQTYYEGPAPINDQTGTIK